MEELNISIIQSDLVWEDIDANLENFTEKISSIHSDIIILPEMFSTGFSMNAVKFAEDENGKALSWMKEKAKSANSVITGSVMTKENGNYYNRLYWVEPSGKIEFYDKRHLFGLGEEDKVYSAGKKRLIVEYNGWKICPMICYDLRFPVWCRNKNEFDVQIFVANWPEKRSAHWKALLQARAIENQVFVVGVNRVGTDANGYSHSGDSTLIDPIGEIIFQESNKEIVFTYTLSKFDLKVKRKQYPFLQDGDDFKLL